MDKLSNFIKKYDVYILIILGLLLYFPALFFEFISDDVIFTSNQYLNGKVSINFINFFEPNFILDEIYSPLTFIIQWLIIKIFGLNSFVFHFVNLVFYVSSSIVLFYLLKRIIDNDLISFFAVILYTIHPCHIECTAWVSAIGYNIASLFFFLSFLFFILAFDENKKLNYVYSIIFYILAILNQPIAVTLPAILFLWVYCFRKERLKESIIFICSYIPFLFIYLLLFYKTTSSTYRFKESINYNILEKFSIIGFDFFNNFIPVNLCPIQPIPSEFYIIFSFIFLLFIYYFRNNKLYLFFSLFLVISLLPYSNLFFNILTPLADRYFLLSSVSSCVFISIFSFLLLKKFESNRLIKYLSFIVFLLLFIISFICYLPIWKDNRSLWMYAYNVNPNNMICAEKYSVMLIDDKKYNEAINLIDKIIQEHPTYYLIYELKIEAMIHLCLFNEALDICFKLKKAIPEYYKIYIYLFEIYVYLQDYDKASENLVIALNKAKEYNLYKNNKIDLFAKERLMLAYINADPENFVESFRVISNDFKLLQYDMKFSNILEQTDYNVREEICLNYLKKYNTDYSQVVIQLLNCFYMREKYKENASEVMKSLLKDMYKAQEFINNGDNNLAEKKYLSIISKDKYMYQAYYNLGILYLQTNRKEEAKDIFSKMLNINPNDEQVIKLLNGLRL